MALAFVKKTPTGTAPIGGGAGVTASGLSHAASAIGNMIIVGLTRWREAAGTLATLTASSITDSEGNVWYKGVESINTRDGSTIFFCYAKSTASTSISVSFGSDSAYWTLEVIAEISGAATGLTDGGSGSSVGSSTSTSPSSGAVSPSGNCFYVGLCEFDAAVTCTEGWTLSHEDETFTYSAGASQYLNGSGSQTAGWTLGTSAKWTACVLAIAEGSVTPPSLPIPPLNFTKLTVDGVEDVAWRQYDLCRKTADDGVDRSPMLSSGVLVQERTKVPSEKKWTGKCLCLRAEPKTSREYGFELNYMGVYKISINGTQVYETALSAINYLYNGASAADELAVTHHNAFRPGLNFSSGLVIPASQAIVATLTPYLSRILGERIRTTMVGTVGGVRVVQEQITILNSIAANQTIFSYTPASDFTLKSITIEPSYVATFVGYGDLRLNGGVVFETPALGLEASSNNALDDKGQSGWGMGAICIPIWGIVFYPGDNFEFRAFPIDIGEQIYTMNVIVQEGDQPTGNAFDDAKTIGEKIAVAVGSQTVNMIYANNQTSITFPHGVSDASTQTLSRKMFMQETAFTNAQAVQVLQWAYNNGKFSSTVSDPNGLDSTTAKHGGQQLIDLDAGDGDYGVGVAYSAGVFSAKTGYADKPLVCVSWYGAVMLCNWLTEMKDGNTNNLVYTGIDTTWLADETVTDLTKKGYRLPTRIEYWYCARYRGNDNTNTVSGYTSPYFTQGDSASGATADYTNATATALVAVYNTGALAAVKSKTANALGLYDITGNVWEWFENYTGNGAYNAGSCWERAADQYLEIGVDASSNACTPGTWDVGFRLAKTQ